VAEADDRLEAAIADHRQGKIDEAASAYAAILKDDPDNHRALSVSAILAHRKGDSAEGIRLLERAIALAPDEAGYHNNLGNIYRASAEPERALDCYRRAATLEPTNVETMCNVGTLCRRLSMLDDARQILETVRSLVPDHPETNHNLALIYAALDMEDEALDCIEACHGAGVTRVVQPTYHARVLTRFGRRERAIELLERCRELHPDDPEIAYELKALRKDAPDRAPDDYVRRHFDGFAEGFDRQLASLDYRAPEYLGAVARGLVGDDTVGIVLDLGCGTGLLGPHLRPISKTLIGVDLSTRMLRFAERRECYDQLGEMELTEALRKMPEGSVDIATAADTLCYFGDLSAVFAGLARALRSGGAFLGTVELHEGDEGPRILDSGRYSHSTVYVEETAKAAGLTPRMTRHEDLRFEFGEPVKGLVFALENTGAGVSS
jgi:predicted TPR repeat methyltransferase